MFIIIPAYEPDGKLPAIIQAIKKQLPADILVVDDGSGAAYTTYFAQAEELGATILRHEVNRGKGAALKTAFAYLKAQPISEMVIVTADSDGQHLVEDIAKVANRVQDKPEHLVLGTRAFVGKVPLRSRFGNRITAMLFHLATGLAISDTQTGLRGFSHHHLDWLLSLSGERFEYEFNMLLESKQAGVQLVEEPIETVYLQNNESSHFRPIRDSLRIYAPFLNFVISSGAAALVDIGCLLFLTGLTQNLIFSVLTARLLSSGLQYLLNAKLVFKQKKPPLTSLARYGLLVLVLMACNVLILRLLVGLGIGLLLAKICTEIFLFILSYRLQQRVVFNSHRSYG